LSWFNVPAVNTVYPVGYMGDSFYRSKDPTNSVKVLKEKHYKGKPRKSKKAQNTHTHKIVDNKERHT